MKKTHIITVTAVSLGLLLGCSSKSNFYQLQPANVTNKSSKTSNNRKIISIGSVEIPEYLTQKEMVTHLIPGRLNLHETERWIESLDKNIQSVLRKNLSNSLSRYMVISYPWEEPFNDDYRILLKVEKFDSDATGLVTLDARWSLVRQSDREVIISQTVAYKEQGISPKDNGGTFEGVVNTQSKLLERLSEHIAKKVSARI